MRSPNTYNHWIKVRTIAHIWATLAGSFLSIRYGYAQTYLDKSETLTSPCTVNKGAYFAEYTKAHGDLLPASWGNDEILETASGKYYYLSDDVDFVEARNQIFSGSYMDHGFNAQAEMNKNRMLSFPEQISLPAIVGNQKRIKGMTEYKSAGSYFTVPLNYNSSTGLFTNHKWNQGLRSVIDDGKTPEFESTSWAVNWLVFCIFEVFNPSLVNHAALPDIIGKKSSLASKTDAYVLLTATDCYTKKSYSINNGTSSKVSSD